MATQTQKGSAEKKQTAPKGQLKGSAAKPQQQAAEDMHNMIAEEAYRIAQRRGFQGDLALDDWLQAEATINSQYQEKH